MGIYIELFTLNEHNKLIQDAQRYSSETQIFSNIFTEKLIDEAIKRNCNIVVEGTMRNPDVPNEDIPILKGCRV